MIWTALLLVGLAQISVEAFELEEGDRDVFPAPFRGTWGSSLSECARGGLVVIEITDSRMRAYESNALLLKNGVLSSRFLPDGREAFSVISLLAYSSEEGDVGTGKWRVSRVGEYLHTSDPESVSEEKHFSAEHRWVRCP